MQKIKCKKCGKFISFESEAEKVVCNNCGAKYAVSKKEKEQSAKKETIKPDKITQPKNRKKKNKKGIIAFIIFLSFTAIIISSLFVIDAFAPANPRCYHKFVKSTFNGSYDGKNTPNDYYQVEVDKEIATDRVLYSFVDVKVSSTNARNLSEIWINISDVYEDELTITLSKGYATDGKTYLIKENTLSARDIKRDKDGWFLLYSSETGLDYNDDHKFLGELKVGFSANVRVRELIILDIEKELCSMNVTKCSIGVKPSVNGTNGYSDISIRDAGNLFGEHSTCPFIKEKQQN